MKKIIALLGIGLLLVMTQTVFISCSGSSGGGGGGDSAGPPATLDKSTVDETMAYVVQTVPGCTQATVVTSNQVILDTVATITRQASEKKVGIPVPLWNGIEPAGGSRCPG